MKENKKLKTSIEFPIWMEMLIYIEEYSLLELSRHLRVTNAHLYNLRNVLEHHGLIKTEQIGREIICSYTTLGSLISVRAKDMRTLLENNNINIFRMKNIDGEK